MNNVERENISIGSMPISCDLLGDRFDVDSTGAKKKTDTAADRRTFLDEIPGAMALQHHGKAKGICSQGNSRTASNDQPFGVLARLVVPPHKGDSVPTACTAAPGQLTT